MGVAFSKNRDIVIFSRENPAENKEHFINEYPCGQSGRTFHLKP